MVKKPKDEKLAEDDKVRRGAREEASATKTRSSSKGTRWISGRINVSRGVFGQSVVLRLRKFVEATRKLDIVTKYANVERRR